MPTGLVNGLAVVLLLSRDTDRTAAFYRDVLGLPLHAEEHGGRHRHYACPLGSAYFTIQLAEDLAAPPGPGGYDFLQLCFTVPDLDAFVKHLGERGVTPLHPPRPFEQTTFVTLLDPDGRHVRVMTPWRRESGAAG
jgi:catechol 2,3-dioxygenase-like lactoylglutathione lyase family enzyme